MNRLYSKFSFYLLCTSVLLLTCSASVAAQESSEAAIIKKAATSKFITVPNVPACITVAVERGDPATGPSVLLNRFAAGCSVPWHWHTPNEQLMIVSGVLRIEMKGEKPVVQRAGDFALMPARHVHRATCVGAPCVFFLSSDGPFDVHYAGPSGEEITLAEAQKQSKRGKL
jgi:quercetin dioxygenase-like cupin family protein